MVLASIKYCRVHFLFLTQHFQSWLPPLILWCFTGSDLDVILGQFILGDFCRGATHGIPALYTLGEGYDIPDAVGATDHRQHPLQTYTYYIQYHSVSYTHVATSILTSGLYDSPHDSNIIPSFYNFIWFIYMYMYLYFIFFKIIIRKPSKWFKRYTCVCGSYCKIATKNVVSQKSGNIHVHVVHMALYTCNALRKIISSCKYIHWYPNCSDNMDVH